MRLGDARLDPYPLKWVMRYWGLDGFRVLGVAEDLDELVVTVESTAKVVGCSRCASSH